MDIKDFKKELIACGINTVWKPDEGGSKEEYDESRKICNARFDLYPMVIAYCTSAQDVSCCIKATVKHNVFFRIRSGGHQHEGMCSGNKVLIIDLSKMCRKVDIDHDRAEAWIQPGKQLVDVYKELEAHGFVIPGGGCDSVNVGGLVQGGGWGLWSRKLGLTCDSLIKVQLVDAHGEIKMVSKSEDKDLFWAIRGGGGGNFGVITKFLFKLSEIPHACVPIFSIFWKKEQLSKVLHGYFKLLHTFDDNLTTFARVSIVDEDRKDRSTIMISGRYFGTMEAAKKAIQPLLDLAPYFEPYSIKCLTAFEAHQLSNGIMPVSMEKDPSISPETFLLQVGSKDGPSQTCGGDPNPHKVTSAFPIHDKTHQYKDLLREIIKGFTNKKEFPRANTYLSIHSMGGAIAKVKPHDSAFYYRDREFLLQFQAWWSEHDDPDGQLYVDWVKDFRKKITPYIDGAFINFVDASLSTNKYELLEHYYGGNLPTLTNIKYHYDSKEVFKFEMSIPPLPPL